MRLVRLLVVLGAVFGITGTAVSAEVIRVGVSPGHHEQVFEFVRPLLRARGLEIKLIPFNDYTLLNQALDAGDLDMNSFQHTPYLEAQIRDRGYKLAVVGTNFIAPLGFYSRKIKDLADLRKGATLAIPNDPSNGGRALLLLAAKGVITLDPVQTVTPSVRDVTENPKGVKFREIDAAQLPRVLPDVDAAAINTNYTLDAGLHPFRDAIALEDASSAYANVFVVREENRDASWVRTIVDTYRSDPVRAFILDQFQGVIIPTF